MSFVQARFHSAVARWFERRFAAPTPAQLAAWPAIQAGAHLGGGADRLRQDIDCVSRRARCVLHRDAVHRRVRQRRDARMAAPTSGGTIPETGDYSVLPEPQA
ncbi:hypothetical protein ACFOPN_16580 [Xanthomonas hyacinthi]|uniref:hypothetical protein n=1 Tax=Xanthomonas hyacinthi TaxID=56455 RepID=UPI00062D69E4|nr:hypothetical protein [Xanthomonas hyacinthi]KLD79322.1 hypothetical protein Y886_05265 [Xanthomonas hyacinthi DSM 19077]